MLCGYLVVDHYGRKPALIGGSLLFAAGGLVQSLAVAPWMLIVGRFVAGLGVGITSMAGPTYLAEVAPAGIRGAMVGVYQSNVCFAIVAAAVINYLDHDVPTGWRWSLSVQVLLGLFTAFGLFFVADTPRFLESQGKSEEALRVLTRLRGDENAARQELAGVKEELEEEKQVGRATWAEVFTNPLFRNVIIVGCFVQFFQIITGINAMVSFGGTLFASLGVSGLLAAVAPQIFFFIGNAIGSFGLAERLGRRPLLIWGMVSMAVTMLVGGITALTGDTYVGPDGEEHLAKGAGLVIIAMVAAYMFSFGMSWGFGAWLWVSEVMPLRVRGQAVGLCTFFNWGPANVFSAQATPIMITMSPGGTLLFFGCLSVLVVPFAVLCISETKGRVLEEITPMFHFKDCSEFRAFMRGNLHTGDGMGVEPTKQTKSQVAEAGQSAVDTAVHM